MRCVGGSVLIWRLGAMCIQEFIRTVRNYREKGGGEGEKDVRHKRTQDMYMHVYTCTLICTIDAWAFKGTATGYIFHVPQ